MDAARYDRDEVAVPIDGTFYTSTDPQAGEGEVLPTDTGTSSSSPIDIQRLEAEIAEADRLLSPQGEQEAAGSP
jgi:hypothetical protein